MKKGIVFTLISVLIAISLFSLLTNYRLFTSELELGTSSDIGIAQTFLYAGSHVQKIADTSVRVTFNASHVFVNFTDRAPRNSSYNDSLKDYRDFFTIKLNLSYRLDFNATVPANESAFDIEGMNAQYNYSNFTKHNISVLQKQSGEALFIKRYDVYIAPLHSSCSVNSISLVSSTSGNLTVHITNGAGVSRTDALSRTGVALYKIDFTPAGTCPGTVNVTVGKIDVYNASLRVDPREKAWVNITVFAKTSELPR